MGKFMSRRMLLAVGGVLTVVLSQLGLDPDLAANITQAVVVLAGAAIAAVGAEDVAKAVKKG